jgi:hypothetical protein
LCLEGLLNRGRSAKRGRSPFFFLMVWQRKELDMRTTLMVLAVAAMLGVLTAGAWAQAQIIVKFDENGNVTIDGQPSPSGGNVGLDTGPGGGLALIYPNTTGVPFVPGDVLLFEPTWMFSDVVRFNANQTIAFYSEASDSEVGPADLADTGYWPTAWYTNLVQIPETGLEGGANGALYIPTPNQPGFVDVAPVAYEIVSDVPEPATLSLLALGGLLALRRRGRNGG